MGGKRGCERRSQCSHGGGGLQKKESHLLPMGNHLAPSRERLKIRGRKGQGELGRT